MDSSSTRTVQATTSTRKPTEYLFPGDTQQLGSLHMYLLIKEGFVLEDVKAMLAASQLYSSAKLIRRITGKPNRASFVHVGSAANVRLNAQQSAIAFQYAKALEHATAVFGTQQLAEEWLSRPCKYLAENIPLDLLDNPIGFQATEEYLERVEHGIYQ